MPGTEQTRLKCTQPEPLFTPLRAPLRLPRLVPERSLFRAQLIAPLQRLLKAPFLAEIKPQLLAALRVQLQTLLLTLVLAPQRLPLLIPEPASLQPLHFASQRATLFCPPGARLHLRPDSRGLLLPNTRSASALWYQASDFRIVLAEPCLPPAVFPPAACSRMCLARAESSRASAARLVSSQTLGRPQMVPRRGAVLDSSQPTVSFACDRAQGPRLPDSGRAHWQRDSRYPLAEGDAGCRPCGNLRGQHQASQGTGPAQPRPVSPGTHV